MKKKKVVILNGGFSPEKEISKKTGEGIFDTLSYSDYYMPIMLDPAQFDSYIKLVKKIKEIQPYIVFNALHGDEGENGKIQALLELEKIDYTGSDVLSSALAMNKFLSNLIVKSINLPVPDALLIEKNNIEKIEIEKFPIVVKPNDKGSSVGISIVNKKEELKFALEKAFNYSNNVLIEEYIPGRELTVTVLQDRVLPVLEIVPKDGWYDYTNKYTKGKTEYIVPAKLEKSETEKIKKYAELIFKIFGCKVYARIDFRFDGSDFYFLEVNTLPGMTPLSLTPKAAKSVGMSFEDLLVYIIENSKRREL